MSDPIVINHDELQRLSSLWGQRERDAEDRQSEFNWGSTTATTTGRAHGNLGVTWVTKLGADGYDPGKNLSDKIEKVRANLGERITKFGDDAYQLQWGLDNLTSNMDACEHFNTMTADGFNAAFPQAGG